MTPSETDIAENRRIIPTCFLLHTPGMIEGLGVFWHALYPPAAVLPIQAYGLWATEGGSSVPHCWWPPRRYDGVS